MKPTIRKKKLGEKSTKTIVKLVFLSFLIIFIITIIRIINGSIFFQKKSHIQLVVYGKHTSFFSFGSRDGINYGLYVSPDDLVDVPGGYGVYRVGALGKLIKLEKDTKLLLKTFSATTGSFVDLYLSAGTGDIYYGTDQTLEPRFPTVTEILFNESNMNVLERFYILSYILKQNNSVVKTLRYSLTFADEYQGFFFDPVFRKERLNVQIIYSKSYKSALKLSQIIEGEGIRVGDIVVSSERNPSCAILENTDKHTYSAEALARFFNCPLKKGKTGGYDILFILGDTENDWLISE